MLGGGAVAVALPLLDIFLNGNGTALANGQPMPLRFGTWFWGLGIAKSVFVPKKTGANYDLPEEIAAFAPIQQQMNLLTNFEAFRDNYQDFCHETGWQVTRSGSAPKTKDATPGETLDITIANQIGRATRFNTLTVTASANARDAVSFENPNTPTTAESSPIAFYQRLFGPDFQDPNAATFTPNPRLMLRKSVLSGVMDDAKTLNSRIGAEDRARVDQYFTGLRHLEQQVEQQLVKPEPIAACKAPAQSDKDPPATSEVTDVGRRHTLMTELLAMAVACDQTRVFNMAYSEAAAYYTRQGFDKTHHAATHEEPVDPALGYQPTCSWFTRRAMAAWAEFVAAFAKIKEGDGTLLDHCFIPRSLLYHGRFRSRLCARTFPGRHGDVDRGSCGGQGQNRPTHRWRRHGNDAPQLHGAAPYGRRHPVVWHAEQ
jgi:hypothetical protein